MITKIGVIGLIFITAIVSFFINSLSLAIFLPSEDIDVVINTAIFGSFINDLFLFIWFYVIVAESVLLNINLGKLQSIFSRNILEYVIETLFILSSFPILSLFISDITYSSRDTSRSSIYLIRLGSIPLKRLQFRIPYLEENYGYLDSLSSADNYYL